MKTTFAARIAALVTGLLASGAAAAQDAHDATGSVRLLLALTWEGRDLKEHNLAAVRAFRDQFKDVAFVHFVSPAYLLGSDPAAAAASIRSTFRPGDKIGLALGGWKSMAAAAGVTFRDGPTFWGHRLRAADCTADCGLEVPVSVYPEADATKILAASLDTLQRAGFGRPAVLSTTGWAASPELLAAAAKAGMRYDFSAVAPEAIFRRTQRFPIYQWTKDLWGSVTPKSQPYPVNGVPGLTEIPQTTAAIDYQLPDDALGQFRDYAERLKAEPSKDLLLPLVAYQETAFKELPRLATALTGIFEMAKANGTAVRPALIPDVPVEQPALPVAH